MEIISKFDLLDVSEEAELLTKRILADGAIPPREVRDPAHICVASVNMRIIY
jgi:hypothetical protein